MFDCMEALGMGPRQLYDVTSRGACMLRKASPFFAGLDPFAWTGSASVQCKWHSICISSVTPSVSVPLSSPIAGLFTPQGSGRGGVVRGCTGRAWDRQSPLPLLTALTALSQFELLSHLRKFSAMI